jgi:hypothetical protein
LVVAVGFSTVDPEGLLDDGVCLAPSKRRVSKGGFLGGLSRTVGWLRILGGVSHKDEDKTRRKISEVEIEGSMRWS